MTKLRPSIIAICTFLLFSTGAHAADFIFIINSENSYANSHADAKQEARRLYLREKGSWPDGTKAKPLAPAVGSSGYELFLKGVLKMDSAQVAQHWLRVKQTTGQTPPREIRSDRLLVKMVAKNKGAFAVISTGTTLPPEVKILFKF